MKAIAFNSVNSVKALSKYLRKKDIVLENKRVFCVGKKTEETIA